MTVTHDHDRSALDRIVIDTKKNKKVCMILYFCISSFDTLVD